MDHMEWRADAAAAVGRPALGADLPYESAWVEQVRRAYDETLLDTNVKNMAELRKMFRSDLHDLTTDKGLFTNILMQGRRLLYPPVSPPGPYRTEFKVMQHTGSTDPQWAKDPRVSFNSDLLNPAKGSLEATMIHEYTHLATIALYKNHGEPWPVDTSEEEEKVLKETLQATWPMPEQGGKFMRWEKWIASLGDQKLQEQVSDVLKGYLGYPKDDWDKEALPHVVEIIYYLYKAGIGWWTITEGPIARVADLLRKFAFTPTTVN